MTEAFPGYSHIVSHLLISRQCSLVGELYQSDRMDVLGGMSLRCLHMKYGGFPKE